MNITSLAKKCILIVLMGAIAIIYLFFDFRGLTSKDGMEKAQLGREISRGSFKTKSIKPISFGQFIDKNKRAPAMYEISRSDTYHAPLYPMTLGVVFKVIKARDFQKWKMNEGDGVYKLDYVVAGLNMLFFMMAAGIAYLIARRLFDSTVATLTFFILITTDLLWRFSHTGNAFCLMLLLFMGAMHFILLATEASITEDKRAFIFGTLGGIFLILLTLTHWMGAWLLVGYLVYAFFFIRPIGGTATILIILSALSFAYPAYNNFEQTGNPLGTAFYTLYTGLGTNEEVVFRSFSSGEFFFNVKEIILTFSSNFLQGFTRMFEYSGFIFVVPVFFLSCLHTFNNKAAGRFRWAVGIIWIFASIGMAVYGYGEDAFYSRQLHFLFGPVMAGYGIAMIAILWKRSVLDSSWNSGFIWIVGAVSAIPMIFSLPNMALNFQQGGKSRSTWPATSAVALNRTLHNHVRPNQYIFSDQPWAVSWYADRHAIWIPFKYGSLQQIELIAQNQGLPMAGVLFSPESLGLDTAYESRVFSQSMFPMLLGHWAFASTKGKLPIETVADVMPESADMRRKYPEIYYLVGSEMMYYSAEKVDLSVPAEDEESK